MTEAQMRQLVEEAGAQWLGVQQSLAGRPALVLFRDPQTGSTCSLYVTALQDVEDIRAALRRKAELFAEAI